MDDPGVSEKEEVRGEAVREQAGRSREQARKTR
jgi:hypothetical protein